METNINTKVKAKVSSAGASSLGPLGIVICFIILGALEFDHKFIECKHLLCPVIPGTDFAQNFRVEIDWNNQCHLYPHQDNKSLCIYH